LYAFCNRCKYTRLAWLYRIRYELSYMDNIALKLTIHTILSMLHRTRHAEDKRFQGHGGTRPHNGKTISQNL
jgi:hypothetical protein